jgi:hypothetical protein
MTPARPPVWSLLSAFLPSGRSNREGGEEGIVMQDSDGRGRERGKLAASISNAIVGLHREYYGRGATRARTVMGSNYVICFLEDIYTPVERT